MNNNKKEKGPDDNDFSYSCEDVLISPSLDQAERKAHKQIMKRKRVLVHNNNSGSFSSIISLFLFVLRPQTIPASLFLQTKHKEKH